MGREAGPNAQLPASAFAQSQKSVSSVLNHLIRAGMVADANSANRIKSWLLREARGSKIDLRTPFWMSGSGSNRKWIDRGVIAQDFWSRMNARQKGLPNQILDVLLTHESEQAENIGPQSEYLPWKEDGPEKVAAVYKDKPLQVKNARALSRAIEIVKSFVRENSIRMSSFEKAVGSERSNPHSVSDPGMDITTNSGLPYCKSPWRPRSLQPPKERRESQDAYNFIMYRAREVLSRLREAKIVLLWAMQAKRISQKSDIAKVKRLVIAIEKAEPLIWKTFTPDLLRVLSKYQLGSGVRPFCALLDLPEIDLDTQKVLEIASANNRVVLSGDYSGYDASLPPKLIEIAGDIVSSWIYGGQTIIKALTRSMVNGVILVTPNKIWGAQPSSMKSGSGGTNLLDSICNLLVIYYGQEAGRYNVINAMVQGDDFVLDAEGVNPSVMSEVAEEFGLVAHPDKQLFEPQALSFLQRIHFKGMPGGIASVMRTLGSIMSYEKLTHSAKDWGWEMDVIRARAQLENTVFSPWFEDLVEFVKQGDKYRLGGSMSPGELLNRSGQIGLELIQRMSGAPNKSRSKTVDAREQFISSAVSGVLEGREVPSFGSEARFSFAYGRRASQALSK